MRVSRFFAICTVTLLSVTTLFAQEPVLNMKSLPTDSSGNNNNGTIWGAGGYIKDGKFVNNGSRTALFCANKPSLNVGTGDMTIVVTAMLREKQTPRTGFVSKGAADDAHPGYSFLYRAPKKRLYLYICDGKDRVSFQSKPIVLNDGLTYRIAVSLNRASGKAVFAINGKACVISSDSLAGKSLDSPDKLSIGSWGKGHYINGFITNIQLYKKSFSKDELKALTATQ